MERGKREIPFKFNFKMCYNSKFLNYTVTKTVHLEENWKKLMR